MVMRFCLSEVCKHEGLEERGCAVRVRQMRKTDVCNSWDDISKHAEASQGMVYCNLVDYDTKEWRKCNGIKASVGVKELYNRMDLVA
jgi:hypothetical protein